MKQEKSGQSLQGSTHFPIMFPERKEDYYENHYYWR